MPIPDIDVFNEILGSMTLRSPNPAVDYDYFEAVPPRVLGEESNVHMANPVRIWHKKDTRLKLNRLVDRINEELKSRGHFFKDEMVLSILGLFCLTQSQDTAPVSRLNNILDLSGRAKVSQYLIAPFSPHPDTHSFGFDGFTVGPLNRKRLVYWCKKVNCDFFERYPNKFLHRFAIERSPIGVCLLDWTELTRKFKIARSEIFLMLSDYYFELYSMHLRALFYADFREAQEVLVAAGAPFIDLEQPQAWNGGSFVSVFTNIGKHRAGYFCPLETNVSIDFAQADKRFPAKAEELRKIFSFDGLKNWEIHKTLQTYCRFVVKAKIHETHGREDEAFLHYVVALDLLFGEKDSSTQKVSKRASIVVSRRFGKPFVNIMEQMIDIYGKRCRYVHAGEPVGDGAIEEVRPIVDEVLACLLRLQANPLSQRQGFAEEWLRTLDFFIAAVEADRSIPDQELIAAGIALGPN